MNLNFKMSMLDIRNQLRHGWGFPERAIELILMRLAENDPEVPYGEISLNTLLFDLFELVEKGG